MKFYKPQNFKRKQLFALLMLIAFLFSQTFAQQTAPTKTGSLSATENELASKVSVDTIKEVTAALTAEDMQGRGTMQAGGDKAAIYLGDRFSKLGLKPLGDKGTYLQKINFKESVFAPETSFKLGDENLTMEKDYAILESGDKSVSGDLVFVSYGIVASSINRNDLEGVDLAGKIVVMLQGPPKSISKKDWKAAKATQMIFGMLAQRGVSGIVFAGHGREEQPYDEIATYLVRRKVKPSGEDDYPSEYPPFVAVSNAGAEKLFAKSGVTFKEALEKAERNDFRAFKLNQKAKITVKWKNAKGTGNNVVGYMEGSDPKLKEEAVLFSAHYDAYGVENGKIYPGAADNALGVAEMLAVAEALKNSPVKPRRSVIFLAVTGEEYGLYGSKHWAKNPTWNIKKIAADLNLDGIGTEVYGPVKTFVGYGAEHSTLGAMLEDISSALQIKIVPDPMPEEKTFLRSDHYSFVERGVPSLMLLGAPEGEVSVWVKRIKDWEKVDYHQPGDVIQPTWNWEGARTVAVVSAIMSLRIANDEKMPSWLTTSRFGKLERGNDKELPEEP